MTVVRLRTDMFGPPRGTGAPSDEGAVANPWWGCWVHGVVPSRAVVTASNANLGDRAATRQTELCAHLWTTWVLFTNRCAPPVENLGTTVGGSNQCTGSGRILTVCNCGSIRCGVSLDGNVRACWVNGRPRDVTCHTMRMVGLLSNPQPGRTPRVTHADASHRQPRRHSSHQLANKKNRRPPPPGR